MANFDKEQVKKFIAEQVSAGVGLSKIQELLASEKGVKMTFMELRMLAAEIESVDWSKTDKPEPKEAPKELSKPAAQEGQEALDDEQLPEEALEEEQLPGQEPQAAGDGKTKVEISKIVKPGSVASGSVTFASGVTAEWFVDQMGRLGLGKASGKPTPKDIEGFQAELQRVFAEQGY